MLLPSERATKAVKERQKPDGAYGDPEPIYAFVADLWSAYTGADLSSVDVAFMQAIMKMAREKMGNHNEDNLTDIAGYADVAELCQ